MPGRGKEDNGEGELLDNAAIVSAAVRTGQGRRLGGQGRHDHQPDAVHESQRHSEEKPKVRSRRHSQG